MFPRRNRHPHHPVPPPGMYPPGQEFIVPEVFTTEQKHVKNHVYKYVPVHPETHSYAQQTEVKHTHMPPQMGPPPRPGRRRPFPW
ncbi:CotD family spore coat protein [Geomicrobium sp. JSM 1781026]|uniref:CotD family spore coat protein n=1 Tax=Geomicrobium sp. JSM 1781026 TaxID=3344580 RepID=UPI0035C229BC